MSEKEWLLCLRACVEQYGEIALSGLDKYSISYKSAKIAYDGLSKYVMFTIDNRIKSIEGSEQGDNKEKYGLLS